MLSAHIFKCQPEFTNSMRIFHGILSVHMIFHGIFEYLEPPNATEKCYVTLHCQTSIESNVTLEATFWWRILDMP